MQFSYQWLKEYIDFDLTPEELSAKLTGAGIEVERVESLNKGLENVVVGKVLEVGPHPNSDHLSLCTLTTDNTNELSVVCGAANVREGQLVPFAQIGAQLPGGLKIKKAKIRGEISQGMICSANELGIDADEHEGILVLAEDAPLGADVVEYLNLDDYILELDLTPNRSDCLSIFNIVRELGAILNQKVNFPLVKVTEIEKSVHEMAQVKIEAPEHCYRYVARIVQGVKIKPSPRWLRHKLHMAGIRSINNVVDITNLVMLEYGQPLHAFDYNLVHQGQIIVRLAEKNEKITTLDDQERNLDVETLLIADPVKSIGIAGVMGGENTEITEDTATILIESAYFEPSNIRRTATKLGLRTDASVRFEKGINMETVAEAADRAAQLMVDLAEGEVLQGSIDVYPVTLAETKVNLELGKVNAILGTKLSPQEIKDILARLNFKTLQETEQMITVQVPSYRQDVQIAEDLVEEVARLYGYDNIPTTLPYGATNQGRRSDQQIFLDRVINNLVGLGLNEMINYSFIHKNNFDKLQLSADDKLRETVPILNPLSEEQGVMRTTLLPGLLASIRRNINHRNEDLQIFELGKVYWPAGFPLDKSLPEENLMLGIAVRGKTVSDWQNQAQVIDFYYLKGLVEALFQQLQFGQASFKLCSDHPSFHPGRTAKIMLNNVDLGIMGELHPQVADNYDLPTSNYLLELNLQELFGMYQKDIVYQQLPKYPAVSRDLAILVGNEINAEQILSLIRVEGGELLQRVDIFDYYTGSQIKTGFKSLAFSLTFQAEDRTLTDEEINQVHNNIQTALQEQFAASLRA